MDDVYEQTQTNSIGRPHIASTLLKLGLVSNFYEAFEKYLHDNGPAYEKKIHVSPRSAIKLINDAGGLSFIAHPGNMKETILKELIDVGVDGIEVIHPSHSRYFQRYHRGIANQYCLLESGGSDFHGGMRNDEMHFGQFTISNDKVNLIRNMLNKNYS